MSFPDRYAYQESRSEKTVRLNQELKLVNENVYKKSKSSYHQKLSSKAPRNCQKEYYLRVKSVNCFYGEERPGHSQTYGMLVYWLPYSDNFFLQLLGSIVVNEP
jgi:hypothetical protein